MWDLGENEQKKRKLNIKNNIKKGKQISIFYIIFSVCFCAFPNGKSSFNVSSFKPIVLILRVLIRIHNFTVH